MTGVPALAVAATRTTRGKRHRPDVSWFLLFREAELARIAADLRDGTWRHGPYDRVFIREPKPRLIARAQVADRVVHTAVADALAPVIERGLAPEDFASRTGLGAHRAVLRLRAHMQRHRFALHLDVRAYFPSIDASRALGLVAQRVADDRYLRVLDLILTEGARLYRDPQVRRHVGLAADWPPPGHGLAVGSSVSQLLAAHVYLNAFDHWVKRVLRVPGYVRYVDDLFLFGDRRADVRTWRGEVAGWLASERGLRLKHPDAPVLACAGHLDALGHRVRRDGHEVFGRTVRRTARRTGVALETGDVGGLERSVASTVGLVTF